MTAKWKNNGYGVPTAATVGATRFTNLQDGLETALSDYAGTADPDDGAPTAWGATEVGFCWWDTTNQRYGTGDDLGGVWKRWEKTGAASYDWRVLNGVSWIEVSPSTNALSLGAQDLIAFTDLDLTTTTSSYAVRALVQVEITDTLGVGAGVYAEFRKNGVTTDARTRRIYPQVIAIPTMAQFWVDLDSSRVMEYAVAPYSDTGAGFALRIDVVAYQERL